MNSVYYVQHVFGKLHFLVFFLNTTIISPAYVWD